MTFQSANSAQAVNVPTTTETVAVASPPVASQVPAGGGFIVTGMVNILAGTTTTAVVVRVRQGSTTGGTLVGTADTHTLAAGATASIPVCEYFPGPTAPANNQFCITVQQTAATGNGTVNDADIFVDAVSVGGA